MKKNAKLQEEKNELTVKTRVVNAKLLRLPLREQFILSASCAA